LWQARVRLGTTSFTAIAPFTTCDSFPSQLCSRSQVVVPISLRDSVGTLNRPGTVRLAGLVCLALSPAWLSPCRVWLVGWLAAVCVPWEWTVRVCAAAPVWRPLLAWSGACPPSRRDSLPSCRRGFPCSDRHHRTLRARSEDQSDACRRAGLRRRRRHAPAHRGLTSPIRQTQTPQIYGVL